MVDSKKVLKGLECCRNLDPPNDLECPEECPYSIESNPCRCCTFTPLLDDAIALLEELEPAVANWQDQTDLGDAYLSWRCSRCGHYSPTETRYIYCPYCGAKMEVSGDA